MAQEQIVGSFGCTIGIFQVNIDVGPDANHGLLRDILSLDAPFEFISLKLAQFGSEDYPIVISQSHCGGLFRARMVRISVQEERCLAILDRCPSWEHVSLESEAVIALMLHSIEGFLDGLHDFVVQCRDFRGPEFLRIAQKFSDMGRPSHVVVNKACQSA